MQGELLATQSWVTNYSFEVARFGSALNLPNTTWMLCDAVANIAPSTSSAIRTQYLCSSPAFLSNSLAIRSVIIQISNVDPLASIEIRVNTIPVMIQALSSTGLYIVDNLNIPLARADYIEAVCVSGAVTVAGQSTVQVYIN